MSDSFTGQQINASVIRLTAAQWAAQPYIVPLGVTGIETDTGRTKVGDGATDWADLGYSGDSSFTFNGMPMVSEESTVYFDTLQPVGGADLDYYTVPAGKKFVACMTVANTTAGAKTAQEFLKRGGIKYRISGFSSVTYLFSASRSQLFIFEAGDVLTISVAVTGLVYNGFGYLMPDTSPARSILVLPTTALSTAYTVPAGKRARLLYLFTPGMFQATFSNQADNQTGVSIDLSIYFVPNGQVQGAEHLAVKATLANNATTSNVQLRQVMQAGDRIMTQSTSDLAGQHISFHIVEEDV